MYVVTVRKANSQWRIFRRYKEWEDLRVRLHQWCGGAPQMPGKVLFGRMRPEVTEQRVLGLNHFLQQALASPQFACPDLIDFLEREKNAPPLGLDLMVPDQAADEPADVATGADGSEELVQQHALRQLVEKTSAAFIPVSHEPPVLDPAYLAERASHYAQTIKPSDGPSAGATISLAPPPCTPPAAYAVEEVLEKLLAAAAAPTEPKEAALARSTAAAIGEAMGGLAVQGKHEVNVSFG